MQGVREKINAANRRVLDILLKGRPFWTGCKQALEAIPGMTPNTILHAGPPIAFERMCSPMRNAILGAVLFEQLAESLDEAEGMVASGEINLAPCHDYQAVGGMTGITSASMPVHVVVNRAYGNTAYCAPHEGASPIGLGWGTNDEQTLEHARWMRDELGPVLDAALEKTEGIDMRQLIGRAIHMGDECHGRCGAATGLITREMAGPMIGLDLPSDTIFRVLDFMREADIFALHVIMAAARSLIEPAKGVEASTIVTTMARNGVEFGIKVSSLGDRWFTGPAQPIKTVFFSPEWDDEHAAPDIGDSSIVETVGLGGLIHAASPAHEYALGGAFADALEKTRKAREFCAGEHSAWTIPTLDFAGVPLGIDIRKVLHSGETPILDTATAHKEGGKIGIGEARAPMEAFESALRTFAQEEEVDGYIKRYACQCTT